MRYRLRTLLILLAVGPHVLAGAWWSAKAFLHQPTFDELVPLIQTQIVPVSTTLGQP